MLQAILYLVLHYMKHLLTLLLLLVVTLTGAQPPVVNMTAKKMPYKLQKSWVYKAGDDKAWGLINFNDSSWEQLNPQLVKRDSAHIKFKGIGWFRLHFNTDSTLTDIPLAITMEHYGASEVYIDGKLIRTFGEIGTNEENTTNYDPNKFPLITQSFTPGNHVIAVRYANYFAQEEWDAYDNVEAGFSMSINDANYVVSALAEEMAFISVLLLLMMGIFLALGLSHFFLWMYRRSEVSNLYFSLFCTSVSVLFFIPYLSFVLHDPEWSRWATYRTIGLMALACLSLSGVSNKLFGRSKLRFRIIAVTCILSAILATFASGIITVAIMSVILVVALESIILTISAMYRRVPGARIVGFGILFFALFTFTILAIALINQGLQVNGGWIGLILLILSIAALLSIPISMSIYLAWNVARISKNLQTQLEQIQELSDKTLQQEQEKQRYLETEKERLEEEVTIRTQEIVAEKQKSDDLLRNILPQEVADELKERGTSEARYFDHVSVIFTDFVDFTKAGERLSPQELVDELHTCFKAFDNIISKYHIEKIKTIGDAYLAVSGLPAADACHAENTVRAALEIRAFMRERKQQFPERTFCIRIGIHSGAVVAGIVGVKKFAYDIWGDTVNTAARMEQSSESDKINISATTYELIKDKFECSYRGEIAAKNKGDMEMYFVEGVK